MTHTKDSAGLHETRPQEGMLPHATGWIEGAFNSSGLSDCCLIVPTYKRAADVTSLLIHLVDCEQRFPGSVPAEIVVVDGSPDRATEEAVASLTRDDLPFLLKYVRTRPGLTRQRNLGIDSSSGNFVFFLDDDAIPAPDYFRIVRQIFTDDASKSIGAVGACVTNEWDQPVSFRWRVRLRLGIVPRIPPMMYAACGTSTPRAMLKYFSGIREVDILSGCAFNFRREVFETDRFSDFFTGYSQGEDMEMSLRVGRRWKVVCAGDARVIHCQSQGGRPMSFAKGRMEIRNRLFIWRRYSMSRATLLDKIRLFTDFAFLAVLDAGGFVRRPWKAGPILHGAGVLFGIVESVCRPPEFDEPVPRTYQVEFRLRAS